MQKVVVILGPTASGKTNLSLKIARKFGGFIISADSRQVYKNLDIGTAKITKKEMRGIPHFMINIANPKKRYSVAQYQKATKQILRVYETLRLIPIVVGGTGLYIDALIYDWKLPEVPPNKKLRTELDKKSEIELLHILKKIDPERGRNIDSQNKVRLIRAIEIVKTLGRVPALKKSSPYDVLKIGIKLSPPKLRKRIEKRLNNDLRRGLIKEVKKLRQNGLSWKRLNELGLEYRLIALYLQNKLTKHQLISQLKTELWHYAKRQITWFKKDKNIIWIKNEKEAVDLIKKFLI